MIDGAVRPVRQPGRREREQHDRVADPTTRLLQVGLDQVGELALAIRTLAGRAQELREAPTGRTAPVGEQRGARPVDHGHVTGDVPQVEQADRGGEVLGRHLATLRQRPDRVVQVETSIPDRVPEPLGELGHDLRRVRTTVVDEQQVEVAQRAGIAATDAPHRRKGDALVRVQAIGGPRPQVAQPRHDELDQRRAPKATVLDRAGRQRSGQSGREVEPLSLEVPHPVDGERDLRGFTADRAPCGRSLSGHRTTARPGRARRCGPG
ncbi:hypothetical protein GALL_403940 [mine drainage metagenome]|uniref:Uncharacterized protein n=1 Tax=mine drainage metagenome TaxID=410659 RepID=A0A1J5Q3L9_9ZZZZ